MYIYIYKMTESTAEMLDRIIDWCEYNPNFDGTTVKGIKENSNQYGFTSRQEAVVKNIYLKWKIDKWAENRK